VLEGVGGDWICLGEGWWALEREQGAGSGGVPGGHVVPPRAAEAAG